ncbi:MAG: DUF3558 domain-containing protein [Actinomycetota bacterium]|nr:DUF3558 domain-containing protein [Actinomycetota bacterium]
MAGCGSPAPAPAPASAPSTSPAGPTLPPRPMTLQIEGIDPCSLLSAAQRRTLGVDQGDLRSGGGLITGLGCVWRNILKRPENLWAGSLLTSPGAEFALGKDPMRFVQGFATTSTTSIGTDPRWYCTMFVDIGPGQSLKADYNNDSKDIPGMNHDLACAKAQQLAEYMLTALKARQPRQPR